MEVCNVVVDRAVVLQRIGLSAGGVEEIQRGIAIGFSQEFTTGVHIGVLDSVNGFAGTDTVGVVGVAYVRRAIRSGSKLSAIFPSERPASAVALVWRDMFVCVLPP